MDANYERLSCGYHERSVLELYADARTLGYRPTEHGTLQRGYWHAVKVTPVGSGVVVRRAWTTAQVIVLGVVLTLIAIGVAAGS